VGATPSTRNFGSNWPRWSEIANFRSLFARSDSAVIPREKSSINTNSKSTTRFPISSRWTSYVFHKPPKGGSKTQCPKFAITPQRYEIGCQLLLITNRKSHTGFRLVPTSMTLNDLERRNCPYFAFFSPNTPDFQADYVTVVEDRPIMFVKYHLPVPVFHFWPKL